MENKLNILWTSGDPTTAEKMVLMYALNCKLQNWWDEVQLIIWGASAELVNENVLIKVLLKELIEHGVHVTACKVCADMVGARETFEELGVELIYWGEPLTEILKSDGKLLTI